MKKYLLSFIIFGLLFVSQSFAMDSKEVTVMPPANKAEYRECPDGTMISAGEKCPEKAVKAKMEKSKVSDKSAHVRCQDGSCRRCADGTMKNSDEKCIESADKTKDKIIIKNVGKRESADSDDSGEDAKKEKCKNVDKKSKDDKGKKETHRGHVTCLK